MKHPSPTDDTGVVTGMSNTGGVVRIAPGEVIGGGFGWNVPIPGLPGGTTVIDGGPIIITEPGAPGDPALALRVAREVVLDDGTIVVVRRFEDATATAAAVGLTRAAAAAAAAAVAIAAAVFADATAAAVAVEAMPVVPMAAVPAAVMPVPLIVTPPIVPPVPT